MKITGTKVYLPNGKFEYQDIHIQGQHIVAPNNDLDAEVLSYPGCLVIPGLTDIHFHGCVNYDFCNGTEEAIENMAKYEAMNGITQMCPATMTLSKQRLEKIMNAAATYRNSDDCAQFVGINMEGPFISENKKGAQNAKFIRKMDEGFFYHLQKMSGNRIKLLAVAPEEETIELIDRMKDKVVLSFAHSMADYEEAKKGFEAGISHVTHLFNAMQPINHRQPGPILAAMESNCEVEIICDGIHLHPAAIRLVFRMFSKDKVIFISDSMMATGMPDGQYTLGGQEVFVKGNTAKLKDGTIAGSVTNLMDCMRYAVKTVGIPLETAVCCVAVNPAKSIGIYKEYGSIESGKKANLVVLDEKLEIIEVFINGKRCKSY